MPGNSAKMNTIKDLYLNKYKFLAKSVEVCLGRV